MAPDNRQPISGSWSARNPKYPNMWCIHFDGHISDMVDLARAKDAALAWARPTDRGGFTQITC